MVQSKAKTVEQYLAELPPERRKAISKVREAILKNLPKGYEESMRWGMISYEIPLSRYPNTYNKQPLALAALANQKNHMAVYLMNVYGDRQTEQWFKDEFAKSGKKLNMGKSCVIFKKLEDLPLDVIGKAIARTSIVQYLKNYEASRRHARTR